MSIPAPAGRLASGNHAVYDRGCAAHTSIYRYGSEDAISDTCAALHASVLIAYRGLFAVHNNKNRMRAYLNTSSAAGACIGKEFKARHISKIFHNIPLLPHPLPNPPIEGEGTKKFPLSQEEDFLLFFLSLRERKKVRVGLIFILLCERKFIIFHRIPH